MTKYWTIKEEQKLINLREAGVAIGEISMQLGRSINSVYCKVYELKKRKLIPRLRH